MKKNRGNRKPNQAGLTTECRRCTINLVSIRNATGICRNCLEQRCEPSMPRIAWLERPMPGEHTT